MAFCSAPARAEEYKLSSGDILDFTVAGAPDLQRKAPVGADGFVSLPLVGEIAAGDRTIAQVRLDVRNLISQKEYRQHTAGSQKNGVEIIWPDQVSLAVAEYRPVYLNGDVAKPGEQKFKPGMTIRQALSVAGGFDILRFRMDNPFLQSADLRGAYESAWIDYAKEQSRLSRLQAELNGQVASAEPSGGPNAGDLPIGAKLLGEIRGAEASIRKADDDNHLKQRNHLQGLLVQTDADIVSLTKRRDTEASGTSFDEIEYERINGLYRAGTLPMARVAEARRVELLSATQALQSEVELERAKKDREILRRRTETLEEDRRMTLLKAKQDSQVQLASLQTKLAAIADKLLYAGALKTQLARGTGGAPDLVLFRAGTPGRPVDEDTVLKPGDVVEVALKVEQTVPPATR